MLLIRHSVLAKWNEIIFTLIWLRKNLAPHIALHNNILKKYDKNELADTRLFMTGNGIIFSPFIPSLILLIHLYTLWVNEWMDGWMDGWMNEWMNEWMNKWMNEWMNLFHINIIYIKHSSHHAMSLINN